MCMKVLVNISLGELVDKISILKIKLEEISNEEKLKLVQEELNLLTETLNELDLAGIDEYLGKLKSVNHELWKIEDDIRIKEKKSEFDEEFIHLARSVYQTNDKRFDVKNDINHKFGSKVKEVKSYEDY